MKCQADESPLPSQYGMANPLQYYHQSDTTHSAGPKEIFHTKTFSEIPPKKIFRTLKVLRNILTKWFNPNYNPPTPPPPKTLLGILLKDVQPLKHGNMRNSCVFALHRPTQMRSSLPGVFWITNKYGNRFQTMQTLSNETGNCLLISGVVKWNKKVHFFSFRITVRGGNKDRFHGNSVT